MKQSLNKNGFTLIEILIVISIMSVIITLAFLNLSNPIRKAALDNSYATVITAFESARNKSMQGVGNGSDGHSIIISADGKSIINTNGIELPLSANVTINQHNQEIKFKRISGIATDGVNDLNNPLTFTITDNTTNETRTATITPEGYIYHE